MEIRTRNEFDNYLNSITFNVAQLTGVLDEEKLADFKIYIKDYVLGEILSKKEVIDLGPGDGIPVGIRSALAGSGISYGTIPGNYISVESFSNSEALYDIALDEYYLLDRDLGGDYYPHGIEALLRKAEDSYYQDIVGSLVNYELGLEDRLVGYVPVEDSHKAELLSGSLSSLSFDIRKVMRQDGLDQSNSITYSIINSVFNRIRHYSLAEKRALVGMVYVDTIISNDFDVDDNLVGDVTLNVEAASYLNEDIARLKTRFKRLVNDYYGVGKIVQFPTKRSSRND